MKYFQQFPTIKVTDYNGNFVNVTNIMERTEIIPTVLNNALVFYSYNIKDGDTPDIIAQKYYGDSLDIGLPCLVVNFSTLLVIGQ